MKKGRLNVAGDLFYTIMATVVLNIALQIIIYPIITNYFGEAVTGNILYFIGFIYIIPQSLGLSLNNSRLVLRKNNEVTNADFSKIILVFSAISALICGFIGFSGSNNIIFSIFYGIFSIIYLLRIYAQVEFRLNLKFRGYFIYYCIISLGYIIGLVLYFLTNIWLLIFIAGEASALLYSVIKGDIFKKQKPTCSQSIVVKTISLILLSTFIREAITQFDKVILMQLLSADSVTQYHIVSLIPKTIQLLIQPIGALMLSYLTVKDSLLTRKTIVKFYGISLGCGTLFYGLCLLGTPIYVKLFYPTLYDAVMPYNLTLSLGLIIGFIASLFMTVLLSQGRTTIHTTIQIIWGITYICAAYLGVLHYSLWGLVYVTIIVNLIKLVVVMIVLLFNRSQSPKALNKTE